MNRITIAVLAVTCIFLSACVSTIEQPCRTAETAALPLKATTTVLESCLQTGPVIFDTMSNCASQPQIDRAFGTTTMVWKGHEYLLGNIGNEIRIWRIDNPLAPTGHTTSSFNVPNVGDSDYDLQNFAVCDDCRYGFASYKAGAVVFDLGTGTRPYFEDEHFVPGSTYPPGGYTMPPLVYGPQLLVAKGFGDSCMGSALYQIEDVDDLTFVHCLEVPGRIPEIVSGDSTGWFHFLADRSTRVFVFGLDVGPALGYVTTPWTAYAIKDSAQDVDDQADYASVASASGLAMWDLLQPYAPTQLSNWPADLNRSSIGNEIVFAAKKGYRNSEITLDITDPAAPLNLGPDFWDPANSWNWPGHQCAEVQGGTFSRDGTALYVSRYSVLQVFDASACGGAPPSLIFADGFESGDFSAWSAAAP